MNIFNLDEVEKVASFQSDEDISSSEDSLGLPTEEPTTQIGN